MHYTKDYSKSPAACFDALEDIKDYLGKKKWKELYPQMKAIVNTNQFAFYCSLAGISGLPVRAWYDHYHGQGTWEQREAERADVDA